MKKLIAILMVVLMLAAMPVAASAATTTLTTNVPEATYTMNIPADMEIPYGATETDIGTVTITDSEGFAVGKNVYVKVEYDGLFKAESVSSTISYSLLRTSGGENTGLTSGSYLEYSGQSNGGVSSTFSTSYSTYDQGILLKMYATSWGKALAGEYSTIITFTAQVANEEPTA